MRVTSKARYAVTAMLDITLHAEQGPVALAEIAERQGLSLPYLEQLFSLLRRSGLVSSVRGPAGGYLLGQGADTITIGMVMQAVNEGLDSTRCRGLQRCQQGDRCLTHDLWAALNKRIHHFLSHITLNELANSQQVRQVACRQDGKMVRCRVTTCLAVGQHHQCDSAPVIG